MINLNDIPKEKIDLVIAKRVEELERTAIKIKEIGNVERPNENASHHKGFISKDTKVCYTISQNGYSISSTDYLYDFINYIKNNNLSPTPNTVFKFLDEYFGSRTSTDVRNERDFTDIANFKHSGNAMCTERAALANNILSFLGIETYFCDGAVCNTNGEGEAHAFLIIKNSKGKYSLYDPTYSIYCNNEDQPYIISLSEEAANRVLTSSPNEPSKRNLLTVPLYYFKEVDGKRKKIPANSTRTYGVGVDIDYIKRYVNNRNER